MTNETPENNGSLAAVRLGRLVSAWNQASFEAYCQDFTRQLVDHYNPSYFERIRAQSGRWLSNDYLGCLKQGCHSVHLWRSRFENSQNDTLFSLTLNGDGMIVGLLKRFARV